MWNEMIIIHYFFQTTLLKRLDENNKKDSYWYFIRNELWLGSNNSDNLQHKMVIAGWDQAIIKVFFPLNNQGYIPNIRKGGISSVLAMYTCRSMGFEHTKSP